MQVVKFFLDAYKNRVARGYTQGQLVEAARLLVRPLVQKSLEAGEEVIDVGIIDAFSTHIWGVASEDASNSPIFPPSSFPPLAPLFAFPTPSCSL